MNYAGGVTGAEAPGGEGGGLIESLSTASTGRIQQPTYQQNVITTHVAIPDGGTLLLGGQKLVGEAEREMGVPALSKLPIINRLFTNKAKVMDESVLLILIKRSGSNGAGLQCTKMVSHGILPSKEIRCLPLPTRVCCSTIRIPA